VETLTSPTAATCSDVGDDHVEMEPDEVTAEMRGMNSADALVENTAIDDTDCSTELNDVVRNCNEWYCASKYIHLLLFVVVLCQWSK